MSSLKVITVFLSIFILSLISINVMAKEGGKKKAKKELETFTLEGKLIKKGTIIYLEDDKKKLTKLPPLKKSKQKNQKPVNLSDFENKKVSAEVKGFTIKKKVGKKIKERKLLKQLIAVTLLDNQEEEKKEEEKKDE